MALRTIRIEGDEILNKISKPVKEISERESKLIKDMMETMEKEGGCGLAAVQVGVLKRIFIANPNSSDDEEEENVEESSSNKNKKKEEPKKPKEKFLQNGRETFVFVNPEITYKSKEEVKDSEGCLSIPKHQGVVIRPKTIKLKAFDENMKPFELTASDFFARIILHENDHLDGILYDSKVVDGEFYEIKEDQQ